MALVPQQHFWCLLWALCWCTAPLLAHVGLPPQSSALENNQVFRSLIVFRFWARVGKQLWVRAWGRLSCMQAGGVPAALAMCGLWAPRSGQNFLILIQSLQRFLKQHDLGMCFTEWEIVFIFKYFALGNFWIFFFLKTCFMTLWSQLQWFKRWGTRECMTPWDYF